MNKYEYFRLLVETSKNGGFPAVKKNELTGKYKCCYRTDDGKKCAIGLIIPEEKYNVDFEDRPYRYLVQTDCFNAYIEDVTTNQLDKIQTLHDQILSEYNTVVLEWNHQYFVKGLKDILRINDLEEVQKFQNDLPNLSGYTHSEVIGWNAKNWENKHDFIQWVFPTDQPSQFNEFAPVLSKGDYNEISHVKILDAYVKFLEYVNQSSFLKPNHNHLRTTRVLRSLALCNCRAIQFEFLDKLYELKWFFGADFGGSWNYWVDQLKEDK